MNTKRLRELQQVYRTGLLDDTIPFWMRHGLDREAGGLLTGLDRDGTVIERYSPTTTPASLARDIEAALGPA